MLDAQTLLERQYHEMRWHILSLAADLDRVQRAAGGETVLQNDKRIAALRKCIDELHSSDIDRAERVQMILSDRTPDPRIEAAPRKESR